MPHPIRDGRLLPPAPEVPKPDNLLLKPLKPVSLPPLICQFPGHENWKKKVWHTSHVTPHPRSGETLPKTPCKVVNFEIKVAVNEVFFLKTQNFLTLSVASSHQRG